MSQTIDQKVVEMKFDNSDFETNVKQSMSTLDKLKKELDLEGSAESFKELSKAAKDVSFDSLSNSVDEVKVHFSALETVATTALATITSQAVQTGIAMAKSLTVDLTGAGFNQYEKKTESIQTIMNATGKDIDTVNASLDKLIWFADETSYSFSDMVDNVGKFTSVGVDLDDASKAMMGISNWAAVSGQNAQTASRAMYNLSQAMGLGHVSLMDWKSIELANMATSEFKQQVIDTATAMGKLQQGQVTVENFRESLKDKWFDNDVLLKVLGNYGDYTELVYQRVQDTGELCAEAMKNVAAEMGGSYDAIGEKALKAAQEAKTLTDAVEATKDAVKSQWATLFENVFGNYEEARVTFTNLANTLYEIFATPIADLNETVEEAMDPPEVSINDWQNLRKDMMHELGLTSDQWKQFEEVVKQVAKDSGVDMDAIMEKNYGSFSASLLDGWLNTDIIKEAYDEIVNGTASAGQSLEAYQEIVKQVWNGDYGVGEERKTLLEAAGYDYEEIQRLVDLGYDAEITMDDLGESARNLITLYGDDLAEAFKNGADGVESFNEILNTMSGRDLRNGIWDNLFNADYGAVVTYVTTIREAFADIFGTIDSGAIHDLLANVYTWTLKLLDEDRIEGFKTTVENIFHAVHAGVNILKGAFSVVKAIYDNTLGPLLSGLWDIIKAIAGGIGELFAKFDQITNETTIFSTAVDYLNNVLAPVKRVIEAITEGIAVFITSLFEGKSVIRSFGDVIIQVIEPLFGKEIASKVWAQFKELYINFAKLRNALARTFENIGDLFSRFWSAIQKTELGKKIAAFADTVVDAFKKAWEAIKNWFNNITGNLGGDTDIFQTILDSLDKFNSWMENLDMDTVAENISSAVLGFKDKVKDAFTSVKSWFENNETANSVVGFVKEKFQSLKDAVMGDKEDQEKKPFIQRVLDGMKSALEWFRDNLPSIIDTLKGLLGAGALGSLIALILQIKRLFGGGGGIIKGITKVLSGLGLALKGFAFKQISEGILMLAGAFALILGVIGAIAYFVDPDALMATGQAIFVISAGLALLAVAIAEVIKALSKQDDAKSSGKDLMFESIGEGLKSLASGAGEYLKFKGVAMMLIGVAVALGVMTAAVLLLADLNTTQLIQGLGTVIILLGALTAAMKIMTSGNASSFSLSKQGISSTKVGSLGSAMGLIGVAVAILILVETIGEVNKYNLPELLTGMGVVTLIMFELAGMTRLMSKGFKFTNGMGLVMAAVAIKLFVSTIGQIRKYNLEDILKGVITLGAILLEVSLFSRIVSNSLDIKSAAALVIMAVAIEIFSSSVRKLSGIGFNELSNGLLAMVGILATVAGFTWVISKVAGDTEKLGNVLLGIAGIIAAVAAAIWVVADAIDRGINLSEIGKGLGELAVSLVQGLIQAIVGSTDAIISGLLQLLGSLIDYAPQMVDMLVTLVINVLNALSNRMPELAGAIANFCKTLMSSFAEAFKDVDTQPLIDALNEILFATLSLTIIGKFGSIKALSKGILMLAEVIGAFGVIIAAFGALNLIDGFDDFMAGGVDILITIANGIGGFFGALIGSFVGQAVESFASSMPQIATYLSDFMTNLQPFIDNASKVDDTFTDSISRIIDAMLMVTGASFVQTITDALTIFVGGNDIVEYMGHFKDLATALVEFSDILSGNIDADAVTAATYAAQAITALTLAAPKTGGLWDYIVGTADLGDFATNIGKLGQGVADFCSKLQGVTIDGDAVGQAASAIATLSEVAPRRKGLWQYIVGEVDLGEFGLNLGKLGSGVASFCRRLQGITVDSDTVSTAADAIATIVGIAPASNGIWQDIVGEQDLGLFAANIRKLGSGLASFCKMMSGITIDGTTVETAAGAIETLVGIAPADGGIWQDITGTKNLGKFAENLKDLGKGVHDFCKQLSGATIDSTAGDAADVISTLVAIVPESNGFWQEVTGVKDLGNFASNLGKLGQGVHDFCNKLVGTSIDDTTVDGAGKAIEVIKAIIDAAPDTNGFWQEIVGEKDLGNFGVNLVILGTGVSFFIDKTKNITKVMAQRAKIASEGIIEVMKLPWPTTGGLANWINGAFNGEVSFESLKTTLTSIGDMAKTLQTSFADVVATDIASAYTSAALIVGILSLPWPAPDTDGIFGFFKGLAVGSDQVDVTSIDLPGIGAAIKGFADNVVGIDSMAVLGASLCGQIVSTLVNNVPSDAAIISNIPTYWAAIEEIGTHLVAFSTYVSKLNYVMIALAIAAIKSLLETLDTMSDVDFDKATNFSDALEKLGQSGVNKFVSTFSKSKNEAIGAAQNFVKEVASAIGKANSLFTNAATGNVTNYTKGLASLVSLLRAAQAGAVLVKAAALPLTVADKTFELAAESSIKAYGNAFARDKTVEAKAKGLANAAARKVNQYDNFFKAGDACLVGINNGFVSQEQTLYNNASTVGTNMLNSFKNAVGVASPSKKFMETTHFCIQGAVNGFEKYSNELYDAVEETGNTTTEVMKAALNGLDFTDLDDAPVIRPVLDLSSIQNGVGQMDQMLHTDAAIGIDAIEAQRVANSINRLNLGDAEINNVYDDANVIQTIMDLGSRIDDLNTAILNMKFYLNGRDLVGGILPDIVTGMKTMEGQLKRGV